VPAVSSPAPPARPSSAAVTPTRSSSTSPNDATPAERPHQRPARGVTSRQVYDTPDPIVICTEHRSVKKRCKVNRPAPVAFLAKPVPRLLRPQRACCALYLLHAQHCSVDAPPRRFRRCSGRGSRPLVASLAKEAAGRLDLSWPRSQSSRLFAGRPCRRDT